MTALETFTTASKQPLTTGAVQTRPLLALTGRLELTLSGHSGQRQWTSQSGAETSGSGSRASSRRSCVATFVFRTFVHPPEEQGQQAFMIAERADTRHRRGRTTKSVELVARLGSGAYIGFVIS